MIISSEKYLNCRFLIRFGLGVIFIANALTAIFAPAEFVELVKNSFVSGLLPFSPEAFVGFIISINDAAVGLLLIGGFATRNIALWAMVWLVGVMVVVGSSFDALEHFGLLLMALALVIPDRSGV